MVQSQHCRAMASLSPALGREVAARPPLGQYLGLDIKASGLLFLRRAVTRTLSSTWSGWAVPLRDRGRGEDLSPSPPVRHPATAAQESGAMGDKAKPLAAYRWRLCCL